MRRGAVLLALVLMALGLGAGAFCVAGMAGAESAAARGADSALVLVDLLALTALSFLIWPRRA